jgi:hypothetical protein
LDLDPGLEPVGSVSKEQIGATSKKPIGSVQVRSVSKVGPERATAIVLKPSLSKRGVPAHKSVKAKGPKHLG